MLCPQPKTHEFVMSKEQESENKPLQVHCKPGQAVRINIEIVIGDAEEILSQGAARGGQSIVVAPNIPGGSSFNGGDPDGTPTGDPDGTPTGDPDGTPTGDPDGTPRGGGDSERPRELI